PSGLVNGRYRLPSGVPMRWAYRQERRSVGERGRSRRRDRAATVGGTEELGGEVGAARLGFTAGQVVQEFGYGDDVDDDLRAGIEQVTGGELVDEDYDDIADGVVL